MTRLSLLPAIAAPTGVYGSSAAMPPVPRAAQPTVVELFQSQGCSSCPPMDANVNANADRPGVLALSYWDPLGWKDTLADEGPSRHDEA